LLSHLLDILFLFLVCLIAFGLALHLFGASRLRFDSLLESIVVCLPCGLGIVAYLVLALGLIGPLTPAALMALLVAAGTVALLALKLRPVNLRSSNNETNNLSIFDKVILGLLLVNLLITLTATLTPPIANDYDSLTYHLAAPQVYLARHRIEYLPYDHHSNFPFTMEMLYTLGLGLRGAIAAKLFHFGSFVLTLLALYQMGRRQFSRRAGLMAALVFGLTPAVFSEASTAYVDIALALFALLLFYSLEQTLIEKRSGWWVAAGLCGGFLMGTKYLGIVIFAVMTVAMLVAAVGILDSDFRHQMRKALKVLLLACVVASPWYLKNLAWTGNPVYPFAYGIFGGRNWNQETADSYWAEQKSYGDRSLVGLLTTPWRVSVYPFSIATKTDARLSGGVQKTPIRYEVQPSMSSAVGPLYLLFVAPLLLLPCAPPLRRLLWVSLLLSGAWFAIMQYNRYLIPCLAILSIPAGCCIAALQERSAKVRWMADLSLILFAVLLIGLNRFITRMTLPVAIGTMSQEVYLSRYLDQYAMCQWINENLPRNAKIITYGEPRGFYLDREYLWGDPGHHTLIPYQSLRSPENLIEHWTRLGVTHVLINQTYFPLEQEGGLPALMRQGIQTGDLRVLHDTRNGRILVMEVTSGRSRGIKD